MLSVQNYNYQPKVSFKQNPEKQETKPKSFTTHAGLKTGLAASVLGTGSRRIISSTANSLLNKVKGAITEAFEAAGVTIPKEMEAIGINASKNKYWTIPVTIATCAGCGALIDKYINDKRSELAENSKNKNVKDIVKENDNVELTRNGNPYNKTNIGKKYGSLLGIVALPALKAVNNTIKGNRASSIIGLVANAIGGAIGGLILGAITDHYANKGAKKFADK